MPMNISSLDDSLGSMLQSRESQLNATLSQVGQNPTAQDMINMQNQLQGWSLEIQMISAVSKVVSDAFKTVVQRAA